MKKSLVLLLALIMSVGLILAGCGGEPEPEIYTPSEPAPATSNIAVNYNAGAYYTEIQFGKYPQSEEMDLDTLNALDALTAPDSITGYYTYNNKEYAKIEVEKEDKETGQKKIINFWYIVEPITWYVLNEANNQMLVIAASDLDCMKYNETLRNTDWAHCTLRNWLSGMGEYEGKGFYNAAFTAEEQSVIITQEHTTENNPRYTLVDEDGTPIAPVSVKDRVSLLSVEQLDNECPNWSVASFKDTSLRACPGTAYATKKGAAVMTSFVLRTSSWWWLRNTGSYEQNAVYVSENGETALAGYTVSFNQIGVRPVILLDATHITK